MAINFSTSDFTPVKSEHTLAILKGGRPATYNVSGKTVLASQFQEVAFGKISDISGHGRTFCPIAKKFVYTFVIFKVVTKVDDVTKVVYCQANRAGFATPEASADFFAALKGAEAEGFEVWVGGAPGKSGSVYVNPNSGARYACAVSYSRFKAAPVVNSNSGEFLEF